MGIRDSYDSQIQMYSVMKEKDRVREDTKKSMTTLAGFSLKSELPHFEEKILKRVCRVNLKGCEVGLA